MRIAGIATCTKLIVKGPWPPPAIPIMGRSQSRNRYRYRHRISSLSVEYDPDPDLDPDSGCHNWNCAAPSCELRIVWPARLCDIEPTALATPPSTVIWEKIRKSDQMTMPGLNEADTCRLLVVPKLQAAGWDADPARLCEQVTFTDGTKKSEEPRMHAKERESR